VKGEAAALSVRAQHCQSHYFSTTPCKKNYSLLKSKYNRIFLFVSTQEDRMFGTAHNGMLFLDELPEFPRLVLEYSLFKQITNHMHSGPFICHPNNKSYTKNLLDIKCVPLTSHTFVLNIFQSKNP